MPAIQPLLRVHQGHHEPQQGARRCPGSPLCRGQQSWVVAAEPGHMHWHGFFGFLCCPGGHGRLQSLQRALSVTYLLTACLRASRRGSWLSTSMCRGSSV